MPLQATSGAASYDAFGGGVPVEPNYIESVFSCFLYTGNGSTQTINNGIDLAGKGGLVWTKARSAADGSVLIDSAQGRGKYLTSVNTNAAANANSTQNITAFNSNGYALGTNESGATTLNTNAVTYVSWTFRKQPKFFDVVTYTGTGAARTIAHNLGSTPGCIIVKQTSAASNWMVYHRGLTSAQYILNLNNTGPQSSQTSVWNSTNPTSSVFSVGADLAVNDTGQTYVAYLFAHDAGGFGLTGTDNVISCGSFTTSAGGGDATVDLGYEPQWLLVKSASGTSGWDLIDNIRGMPNLGGFGTAVALEANNANAEGSRNPNCFPTATGFYYARAVSTTYIYIAIRRGPMKVPTTGTSVFTPLAVNNATGTVNTTGFPVDLQMQFYRLGGLDPGTSQWIDRLRGFSSTSTASGTRLYTTSTQAEIATAIGTLFNNTGFSTGSGWGGLSMSYNNFRRAPGFFDEVCYTGTGVARTVAHNLTVPPELMIVKSRSNALTEWDVYAAPLGATKYLYLQSTNAVGTGTNRWNDTAPTSSVFTVATDSSVNGSGRTYVAYLFATCAGVSKVGSYTGTGTTQTINCGFTAGSRFVLIKRTDAAGDWYVWDSARGIVAGNDPYLLLNSTAAEVTLTDYVDTAATGFELSSTALATVNVSGGTYIFLAIA